MAKYGAGKYSAKKRVSKSRKSMSKSDKKPSKAFKKAVQSVISQNVEDKQGFLSSGTSLIMYNSGIAANTDVRQLVPGIANGSTEEHRIGDSIKAKSLVIRGYIQLQKDQTMGDVANKRIAVRLLVLGSKRYKSWNDFNANFGNESASLLQKGNTSTRFYGYINDLFTPINREEFTVYYDKVHYLAQDYVAQQVGSSTPTTTWSQDISKGIKFFTIKIPVRGKKLLYDAGVGAYDATNWTAGITLGYAHLDGSGPDEFETRVGLCYDSYFTYEDA